ncbi:MAG: hypothetical protein DYG83_03155 [Candidatus Brocadia sp. AMX2]|nr:MAG: hypothetical protein EDM70_05625 [Candidatus Brocadia sp. AMX2]MBC6931149.1 hypothetical protein [Candidatus Brocadia sp.]MBL1167452.1 hypothetical protein [Candidatus Brocadia sp. AMX1]MCE7865824.1 hypothetical protein [Candidatus Brocadia sp. AMX2]MCQ3916148.1 hypothetical protein [Candidatus Brocadia sp.]
MKNYFNFDKNAITLIRFPDIMYLQNLLSKIFSYFPKVNGQSIRREFKHAFSMGTPHKNIALNEQELALIRKLATVINKRRITVPATMFLECAQPLSYLGSQMMVFFRPFLTFFFTPAEYDLLQDILEKREGIKKIIEELEKATIHRKDAECAKRRSKM